MPFVWKWPTPLDGAIRKPPTVGGGAGFILLADGASRILLGNGTDKLLMAS